MQDHAETSYCSTAVCIGNDSMISLDIVHIYGALFIDLAKVSDTADRTFLLQQFKRDTDFTVAWFSSNIIGHWVLWGSWHCNSSAVSLQQRKDIPFPQTVGPAPSPSMAHSLSTTYRSSLKVCDKHSVLFFSGTRPQLAAWTDRETAIFNTLSAPQKSNIRTQKLQHHLPGFPQILQFSIIFSNPYPSRCLILGLAEGCVKSLTSCSKWFHFSWQQFILIHMLYSKK